MSAERVVGWLARMVVAAGLLSTTVSIAVAIRAHAYEVLVYSVLGLVSAAYGYAVARRIPANAPQQGHERVTVPASS